MSRTLCAFAVVLGACTSGPQAPLPSQPAAAPAAAPTSPRPPGLTRRGAEPLPTAPSPAPAARPPVAPDHGSTDGSTDGSGDRASASSPEQVGAPPPFDGVVSRHNLYRARHCAAPLRWSEELAEEAQGWADTLRFNNCAFEHSTSRYGENLAFFAPPSSGERAVDGWYDEVASYQFSRPGFRFDSGHFTQVVWRDTQVVGCGVAECNGGQIWVCNYQPAGNVETMFERNVLPTSCKRR